LYYRVLRIDPSHPTWPKRDRFVFGKGHAAIALYPILADLGFFDPSLLNSYTRLGSAFADHPDMTKIPGADFNSGSLGHGLSVCVGMALGTRSFGFDSRVYCLLGDGEMNEGQVWEAAMSAAHFGLRNLVAIVDRNRYCLDGSTEDIMALEPIVEKWRSFGWSVVEVDGHDLAQLTGALDMPPSVGSGLPTAVIAHTEKGHGFSMMVNRCEWHLGALSDEDRDRMLKETEEVRSR
jgi:transketolase